MSVITLLLATNQCNRYNHYSGVASIKGVTFNQVNKILAMVLPTVSDFHYVIYHNCCNVLSDVPLPYSGKISAK